MAEQRLIDANALKQHYSWWRDEYKDIFDNIIDQQPTIEPERKTGKWIRMSDADGEFYACSECGNWSGEPTNFCSDCGSYNGG